MSQSAFRNSVFLVKVLLLFSVLLSYVISQDSLKIKNRSGEDESNITQLIERDAHQSTSLNE